MQGESDMTVRHPLALRTAPNRGFTLIEMLIVIVIIGGLMALLTPAIWIAVKRAREAAILAEIDQLHSGLQAYKEKHLVYPPAMAITDSNSRKAAFMSHLRTVYPSSAYGVRVADFDRLNDQVKAKYTVPAGSGTVKLDLMRLDQAEALVFWLGGFPTPIKGGTGTGANNPIAPSRLFGFNKDSDSPMKRSANEGDDPLLTRTSTRFDFRQERLVDNDGDGWWEYLPTAPGTGAAVAPFVYFDYDSYGSSLNALSFSRYPRPGDAESEALEEIFGSAMPLAAYVDPKGSAPTRWQNPESFQIICGGQDGLYSAPDAKTRISIFPAGHTYSGAGPTYSSTPGNYGDVELDNLTNLQRQTLGDAQAEAP
jgi:prepilin-type N-terminal cleavage/methylation domain-containing protein